jgi:hypothetical protein
VNENHDQNRCVLNHKKKDQRSVNPMALLLCLSVPKISTPGVIFLLKIYSQRTDNPPGLLCPNCARQGQKLSNNSKRNQKLPLERLASQGFEKIENSNFEKTELKILRALCPCEFESRLRHQQYQGFQRFRLEAFFVSVAKIVPIDFFRKSIFLNS